MSFLVTSSRFEIQARVGSGGMGVVYRAFDRKRASVVAIKTLSRLDPEYIQRFKNEFRSLSDLTHPNLVCLYELFNEENLWYFTMEYIPGADFLRAVCPSAAFDNAEWPTQDSTDPDATIGSNQLAREDEVPTAAPAVRRGPCDYTLLRSLTLQIAQGLSVLHNHGKLHRDMKPSNVAVTPDGRAVILDFGLVSDVHRHSGADLDSFIVGTLHYMAPEQITGMPLTPATDWYGLGVMMYVALVGHTPHSGNLRDLIFLKQNTIPPAPSSFFEDIPADLNGLCMRLLSPQPDARPGAFAIARLLGAADAAPDQDAWSFAPVFVGRQDEIAVLEDLALHALNGRTVIARLSGDSGVGKSTLISEFLKRQKHNSMIWYGRCYQQESVPYKALDVIVDSLSQFLHNLNPAELDSLLPDNFDSLGRLFHSLRPIAIRASDATSVDHLQTRRRAIDAFKELIRRIANQRPLLIHLDDLQWGDRDSGQMLEELLRAPAVPNLMLILSSRPEGELTSELLTVLAPYLTSPDKYSLVMRRIELAPFDEQDARTLTERLLLGSQDPHAAAIIARGSGGNPFFIFEMARSFVRGGAHQVSPTLDSLIWSRTQSLPEEARTLLEVIAVSGKPLTSFDAYRASGFTGEDPRLISLLRNEHLVRNIGASDELIDTYHDRIREAIVSALDSPSRLAFHQAIASTLIASSSQDQEAIGFHLQSAGEKLLALDYYLRAAEQSASVLAFDQGVRLLKRCIQIQGAASSRDIQLKLAEMLANAGNALEAARMYSQLMENGAPADIPELERKAAYHYCAAGYVDEGRAIARRTLGRAGMSLPASRLTAVFSMSIDRVRLRFRGIEYRERPAAEIPAQLLDRVDTAFDVGESLGMVDMLPAIAVSNRGLFHALETGDPARIARAFSVCASQLAADGDAAQARRAYAMLRVCRQIAERYNEPLLWGYYHMGLGFAAINQGRYAAPFEHFQAAAGYFQKSPGKSWNVATCRSLYLDGARTLGLISLLGEQSRRFLREAEDRGDLFMATNIGCSALPSALLYQGQPKESSATARYWLSQWRPKGLHYQHSIAGFNFVSSELYQGNWPAAYAEAKAAWVILRKSFLNRMNSFRQVYSECLGTAALSLYRESKDKALLAEAAKLRTQLLRERYKVAHASAALLASGIAAAHGNEDIAVGELRRALTIFEGLKMNLRANGVRLRLARLIGGDEGHRQTQIAEDWAQREGVKDLNSFVRVFTGGFKE